MPENKRRVPGRQRLKKIYLLRARSRLDIDLGRRRGRRRTQKYGTALVQNKPAGEIRMDLKTLLSAFGLIFLAELGDKTQLAAISLVSSTKKPLEVFLGAAAALAAVTAIGVLFGEGLVKLVPENIIHSGAAVLFIAI